MWYRDEKESPVGLEVLKTEKGQGVGSVTSTPKRM